MKILYLPIARFISDRDFFPIAQDGNDIQFFSNKADAEKAIKEHYNDDACESYILEFKATKQKILSKKIRTPITPLEWNDIKYKPSPSGRRIYIRATKPNGKVFETIAWRISRNMWNWIDSGKIVSMPSDIVITHWKPIKQKASS